MKPVALNSLELIIITTGICEGVNIVCQVPLLKRETQHILIHTVQLQLDHESTPTIVEVLTLVILPLAAR